MKKRLSLGYSDFKDLIESNCYYVDKSFLIRDIHESGKVVFMTRPRRFGKTLNLSTLRYFYEKGDQPTDHLFKDLKIWDDKTYRELQGQYPVIFVTFKDIFQPTYKSMLERFAITIAAEFEQHVVLETSPHLSEQEKERFKRIRSEVASEVELGASLQFLSQMLHKHYQKNVVILIDEYDVPVQSAFVHGFYDEIILFLKALLTGALKDQSILAKGVVTGIMTLAKAGIFTGLNNLVIYDITNPNLADKFGFTAEETEEMLRYYEIEGLQEIQQWYNGCAP